MSPEELPEGIRKLLKGDPPNDLSADLSASSSKLPSFEVRIDLSPGAMEKVMAALLRSMADDRRQGLHPDEFRPLKLPEE